MCVLYRGCVCVYPIEGVCTLHVCVEGMYVVSLIEEVPYRGVCMCAISVYCIEN